MPSSPHTLREVTAHLEHVLHTVAGFKWGTARQPCPDGRYVIDWDAKILYLDPRLTGDETFAAFIAGCVELDANTAYQDTGRDRQVAPHAVRAWAAAVRINQHATARQRQPARTAATTARRRTLMTSDDPAPDLMTSKAHPARVYDYLLGGKDNYAPDREVAEASVAAHPDVREVARAQRAFMHRAATAVAEAGVDQFLDLGTGIPTEPNLHQIVQRINPAARVVYVDNDPIVLAHAQALMTSNPQGRVAYLAADVRDPASILGAALLTDTLDLRRPVGVSIIGLLHFLDDDTVTGLLAALRGVVTSGSYLTINQTTLDHDDDGRMAGVLAAYQRAGIPAFLRDRDQVAALLNGLDVLEPGIVSTTRWRPDAPPTAHDDRSQWAAVARTPFLGEPEATDEGAS